ncbi:hypothetical protein AMS68_007651 [Peltaster fructicola]|uniref:Transcription factor domain-containing protein n=1 Tax=Peltaster fructicola TaxID=286661 RepID=A0A6H0Y542_9PEZI|nr:hypothetical protein AMS68_007651 [Peltaster fructicola]
MLESPLKSLPTNRPPSLPRASQILPDPFVFVPISTAEAAKGRGTAKSIVRAHVTRVQHAKSSTLSSTQHLESWQVKPQIRRPPPAAKKIPTASRTKSAPSSKDEAEKCETRETAVIPVPKIPASRRNGSGRQDPFWTYPVEYEPYLPAIFAHYIENVAVDIPDLDGPSQKSLLRRRWFPMAMEESATMYAILLMAASHYSAIIPGSIKANDLVYLKSRAISSINQGIRDPKRATSDAMIGAVMKMAAYEAIFGDSAVFSTHMRGLSTMLKMRGGLGTLGLDGLLERMVVWIDLNAAFICGLTALFGNDAFPTIVKFDNPDPYHFAGIQ